MLKVPENKKYRNLPDYMKEHLTLMAPNNTRVNNEFILLSSTRYVYYYHYYIPKLI